MSIGAIFGRLLVAGALATALFALAAPAGMLPAAPTREHESEREHRGHSASGRGEMADIVEVLRGAGFSEPYSFEREHGLIEAKAIGPDGRRYEIYIDPRTGKILKQKEDD
jgi:hypothetical protein